MKTQVLVLVPYDVPVVNLNDFALALMYRHRHQPEEAPGNGRFDYLVGPLEKSLNDPIAEGRLPAVLRRTLSGNICEMARLPTNLVPGALVTPDGCWHDLSDFGWRMVNEPSAANEEALQNWSARYRQLVAEHPHCWVIEVWSHS